jgi:predicted deacylase/methionine-rich copper-binding protein CopC
MQLRQTLRSFATALWTLPKRYTIPAAVFVIISIFYIVFFVIEKPVTFSYAGKTCISRLTFLPAAHTTVGGSSYKIEPSGLIKIGSWPAVARSLCFTPLKAPQSGISKVSLAPFGGIVARQTFALQIPTPVVADISPLSKPIPVSRPLTLKMSGNDAVFNYSLKVNDKELGCTTNKLQLACNVDKLGLAQSRAYKMELLRHFDNTDVTTLVKKDIMTLAATTLTDTSIKQNEVVYAKPMDISLTFDKKVVKIVAALYKLDGDAQVKVPITTAITETGATVQLADSLARSTEYRLVVDKIEATDGSSLVEPYQLPFKVSGGPKVTGVNIGSYGVAMGATVVVSFDQPLSDKQDIQKFVSLTGGASLVGKKANQILVSLANVPRCGDFSIKLTNDLQSQYEIAGNSAWSFASRTICHTISTFGSSAQGRAMNAYYFGSGAATVMYTGAIHGNEVSTKLLMDRWVQDLEAKARTIPGGVRVVVVPTINPDGYARGTRTNANNVDLNRNFATSDWQKDITTVNNQPFPGGGGASAMSEPETKAIASLAQSLRPKVILSYHSIGGMVAANQAGNSSSLAAAYASKSGYGNITGQSDSTFEYSISGTADDWYAQAIGVPSILIELGSHSYHQFERNQAAMWAMLE